MSVLGLGAYWSCTHVDGGAVVHTPDPRPQPLPCRTMSSDTGNPANYPNISGTSPISDVVPCTSKGPYRDKSADTVTTGGPASGCDCQPTKADHGSRTQWSGSNNNGKPGSLSTRELSPANRSSIDAGMQTRHRLRPIPD